MPRSAFPPEDTSFLLRRTFRSVTSTASSGSFKSPLPPVLPHQVLATGDNYGRVKLFRYPCDSALAQAKLYRVHGGASPVSKVRWVGGDQFLVTMSAREQVVMQFVHDSDDGAARDGADAAVLEMDPALRAAAVGDDAALAFAEVRDPVAEALAMEAQASKPWLATIIEPSDAGASDPAAPDASTELERAFGVQTLSARDGLAYNVLNEVLWATSRLVVVYNRAAHAQRFFRGHTAEVSCLSVSRDGRFVASGERSTRPVVRVWDAQTCVEVAVLGPFHRGKVSCVGWAPDGRGLASVGGDVEHSVALWATAAGGWDDARQVAYAPGDHQGVHFVAFLDPAEWAAGGAAAPTPAAGFDGPRHPGYAFATGGVDHCKFWTVEGRTMTADRGLWGDAKVQPLLCACALGPRLVTGAASGHLYVWRGRSCERTVRAHESMVTGLWACPAGILSGGGDGFVKLYSPRVKAATTPRHVPAFPVPET
jgi:hypothetical protein